MNSTSAQTVSGAPNRYTNGNGNVMFPVARTTLAATGHNHTFVYTDEAGNTANTAGTVTGISGCAASRVDVAGSAPFVNLATGDRGVRAITSYTTSAAVATGAIDLVITHPMAYIPLIAANVGAAMDGLKTLSPIVTDASLSFLALRGTATATTYQGQVETVSG